MLVVAQRVQEHLVPIVQNDRWDAIVLEKKSFLKSMQQLLESSRAVLENVKDENNPMESIDRLLNHILRLLQRYFYFDCVVKTLHIANIGVLSFVSFSWKST